METHARTQLLIIMVPVRGNGCLVTNKLRKHLILGFELKKNASLSIGPPIPNMKGQNLVNFIKFFHPGNALAVLDADEDLFNKEHELEMPVSYAFNLVFQLCLHQYLAFQFPIFDLSLKFL